MKRDFKIGDRVRVKGSSVGGFGAHNLKGSVVGDCVNPDPEFRDVYVKGHGRFTFHVCQLVRLNPPKPKPEKKEARRVWTTERSMSDIDKGRMSLFWNHQPALNDEVEFREVLPGEVVVTRETLAKAWNADGSVNEAVGCYASNSEKFKVFLKALGLEVKP